MIVAKRTQAQRVRISILGRVATPIRTPAHGELAASQRNAAPKNAPWKRDPTQLESAAKAKKIRAAVAAQPGDNTARSSLPRDADFMARSEAHTNKKDRPPPHRPGSRINRNR